MRQAREIRPEEAFDVLSASEGRRLLAALARASHRLRFFEASESMLRWSWAHAGAWVLVALAWREGAPWAVLGCALTLAISFVAFLVRIRVDSLRAARAVDRASRLKELVSTAAECAGGRVKSRLCPLVLTEAEKTREEGRWRLQFPAAPRQARYAAVPGALLVMLALLPAGSGDKKGAGRKMTVEEVLGSGAGGALALGRKRSRRMGGRISSRRLAALRPQRRGERVAAARRTSPGAGGKSASRAEKGAGRPPRAYGRASAPGPRRAPPIGGGSGVRRKRPSSPL